MGVFFRYISKQYLSAFFVIFISLNMFFVIVDLLVNFSSLPKSANSILLYVFFLACSATTQVLALSLIFAMILFMIRLIRQNELVSFYALGFSKNKLILYPFLWAVLISLLFVVLNFTQFAYFGEYKDNIKKYGSISQAGKDVFIKYNNSFVYIKSVEPFTKTLQNIKILDFNNDKLSKIISAKKAKYKDKDWVLTKARSVEFAKNLSLNAPPPRIDEHPKLKALKGFEPQFIENISQNSSYSISDALASFALFSKQGISTKGLRVNLYNLIFIPFFAPFILLIMYYFFPIISRFFNLAFLSFLFFIATLFAWTLIFLLIRLSSNGVLPPELGIITPIFLLMLYAGLIFYKHRS